MGQPELAKILEASLNEMIGETPDEAIARQAESIREDLEAALLGVRDATTRWLLVSEAAHHYIEELEADLPLSDQEADRRARRAISSISLLLVDLDQIVTRARTQEPIFDVFHRRGVPARMILERAQSSNARVRADRPG